jgi:uncharacterized membrane protein
MLRIYEIKDHAIAQLSNQSKWGESVGVLIVKGIISAVAGIIPILGPWFIGSALNLGSTNYFQKISRNENPDFNVLFSGFNNFGNAILAALLCALGIGFGIVLLIVPGIILALGWSQTLRILNDNPKMSAPDAMSASWDIMKGHKGDFFILNLSFIGWFLLTPFTLFIGLLFLIPYVNVANSKFYDEISGFRNEDFESLGSEVIPSIFIK